MSCRNDGEKDARAKRRRSVSKSGRTCLLMFRQVRVRKSGDIHSSGKTRKNDVRNIRIRCSDEFSTVFVREIYGREHDELIIECHSSSSSSSWTRRRVEFTIREEIFGKLWDSVKVPRCHVDADKLYCARKVIGSPTSKPASSPTRLCVEKWEMILSRLGRGKFSCIWKTTTSKR